jgi:hypothetical protein
MILPFSMPHVKILSSYPMTQSVDEHAGDITFDCDSESEEEQSIPGPGR